MMKRLRRPPLSTECALVSLCVTRDDKLRVGPRYCYK